MGYPKNWAVPGYAHAPLSPNFYGLLLGLSLRMLRYKSHFYRAMHYSAKRGIEIACRLSVRLSVTLVDQDHIG